MASSSPRCHANLSTSTKLPACLQVPAPRARLLDLSVPDLREYGLSDLRWVATPGHTPGHFSLLHTPSRILLAADAISLIKPSLSLSSSSDANDPRVGGVRREAWFWQQMFSSRGSAFRRGHQVASAPKPRQRVSLRHVKPASPKRLWCQLLNRPPSIWFALPVAQVVTTYQPVASLPGITLRGRPNFICPEKCVPAGPCAPPCPAQGRAAGPFMRHQPS